MKNFQTRVVTDLFAEPVDASEAKLFCKVAGTEEDLLFETLITASRRALEKYTSCSFGKKVIHATWLEVPRDNLLEVPYGPVISIDHVFRIDEEGEEEELILNSDYYVMGDQDANIRVARYWSSGDVHANGIRVEYTAGYGDTTTEPLPEELRLAILKQVATDYELRENIAAGGMAVLMNESKTLAAPYRKKLWV